VCGVCAVVRGDCAWSTRSQITGIMLVAALRLASSRLGGSPVTAARGSASRLFCSAQEAFESNCVHDPVGVSGRGSPHRATTEDASTHADGGHDYNHDGACASSAVTPDFGVAARPSLASAARGASAGATRAPASTRLGAHAGSDTGLDDGRSLTAADVDADFTSSSFLETAMSLSFGGGSSGSVATMTAVSLSSSSSSKSVKEPVKASCAVAASTGDGGSAAAARATVATDVTRVTSSASTQQGAPGLEDGGGSFAADLDRMSMSFLDSAMVMPIGGGGGVGRGTASKVKPEPRNLDV